MISLDYSTGILGRQWISDDIKKFFKKGHRAFPCIPPKQNYNIFGSIYSTKASERAAAAFSKAGYAICALSSALSEIARIMTNGTWFKYAAWAIAAPSIHAISLEILD